MVACGQLMREVGHNLGHINPECGGATLCYREWATCLRGTDAARNWGHADQRMAVLTWAENVYIVYVKYANQIC